MGQVLLCPFIVPVAGKTRVVDEGDLRLSLEEFGTGLCVLHVARHPHVQGLEAEIQIEGVLRGLHGTEIPHELARRLCDEGTFSSELLCVDDAVVGLIRCRKPRELVFMGHPVEAAAVHNGTAEGGPVAIHIFGGRVGHNVCAPLEGPAVDGCREGVVDDERHTVGVGDLCKEGDVKNRKGGIGDGLTEHRAGVVLKGGVKFLLGGVRGDEGAGNAHLLHGHVQEIEGAAVDRAGCHDVGARLAEVEEREEVCCLSGGCQHGGSAALERCDLCCDVVGCGILQAGVEVPGCLQVKELSHVLTRVVLEGGGLVDGDLSWLPVARMISCLHAVCADSVRSLILFHLGLSGRPAASAIVKDRYWNSL